MMKTRQFLFYAAAVWTGLFTTVTAAVGQDWLPTGAPITNWQAIAVSADGCKLAAASGNGLIFTSTTFGATWSATAAPVTNW